MDKENLKKMYNLVLELPSEQFHMRLYRRSKDLSSPHCNSVGCIIGHSTVLDFERISKHFIRFDGSIMFYNWSHDFLNMKMKTDETLWNFMFGSEWDSNFEPVLSEQKFSKKQALVRLKLVIEGLFTKEFEFQWKELENPFLYIPSKEEYSKCYEFEPYKL